MGRRRCCCNRGCVICSDDFNRANSTNVSGWTEVSGDWAIASNLLTETTGNGLIYCNERHPILHHTGVSTVTLKDMQANRIYAIFLNYDPDTGARDWVAVETVGTTTAYLACGTGTSVSMNYDIEMSYTVGQDSTLEICSSNTGLYGESSLISDVAKSCPHTHADGHYSGLEGISGVTKFDDFEYLEHWFTNRDCPDCECECLGYCVVDELVATITATGDSYCQQIDGVTVDMSLVSHTPAQWDGTETSDNCRAGSSIVWRFILLCEGDDPSTWLLQNVNFTCLDLGWGVPGYGDEYALPASVSCDPFELVFGPFTIEESGVGVVCTYYVTITP